MSSGQLGQSVGADTSHEEQELSIGSYWRGAVRASVQ